MAKNTVLLERLKYIVERLDETIRDFNQKPIPYDFYRAIKNDGEDSGWRYECVGMGIEDLREMIAEMENN